MKLSIWSIAPTTILPSSLAVKKRAGIARALAPKPHVMLADEPHPCALPDPATTKSVLACLKDINEKFNVTIVIVTHEMSVIRSRNRVALLDKGKLLEVADVHSGQIHATTPIGQLLISDD